MPAIARSVRSIATSVPTSRSSMPSKPGAAVNRKMRRGLPKVCSTCGAPVESAKIEFEEDGSADCRYCGAVLTG